jgi:hypothetical protein
MRHSGVIGKGYQRTRHRETDHDRSQLNIEFPLECVCVCGDDMLHGCFREAAEDHILAHHRTEWNPTNRTCPRTEPQEHKDLGEVNWGKWF